MLVTAAFVPAAPALVPRVAAGAAADLDELRAACRAALRDALDPSPDEVLVLAGGSPAVWPDAPASFARLGLPDPPADQRPSALQVGRWLLDDVGWSGPVRLESVDGASTPDLGAGRVAVLALADGSARRTTAAPGYAHRDAASYDATVEAALADGDVTALLALDPADDVRLLVGGRSVWQAVARAVNAQGGAWSTELRWSGAPYGVGYFVASWRR